MTEHSWALVGPWYRSESIGGPPATRTTAPIFQKYGDADFMNKFVAEPQKSLRFVCEDFVERLCIDPNNVVTPELRSKFDDSLKLFLNSHNRFYLVVCELHCVLPGFPSVKRDQVCETGFVIRRKTPVVDKSIYKELALKQRRRNQLKAQIVKLTDKLNKKKSAENIFNKAQKVVFDKSFKSVGQSQLEVLQKQLDDSIEDFNCFISAHNIELERQGWMVSEDDHAIGNWQKIAAEPQTLEEKTYPMYPLIADPTLDDHSATGKTLWFGLIPAGSSDIDSQGNPQFDEDDLYHVQCFVRRKKSCCPGRGNNCCHGELVWSAPTQSYRLAAFFDIDGSSHKPINIKMPDLDALKDQANLGPPGRGANVKTIAPANSSLNFGTDGMDMPTVNDQITRPDQQICFFAIFLFFIVALFLFRLFLPIILFLFQLWFLLKLKLCILPSISLDAGLAADLDIKGPEIELEFELEAEVGFSVKFGNETYTSKAELRKKLAEDMGNQIASSGSMFADNLISKLKDPDDPNGLSLDELVELYISMATDFSDDPDFQNLAGQIPLPEDGLVYFAKVPML